jgi:hypothetical protein
LASPRPPPCGRESVERERAFDSLPRPQDENKSSRERRRPLESLVLLALFEAARRASRERKRTSSILRSGRPTVSPSVERARESSNLRDRRPRSSVFSRPTVRRASHRDNQCICFSEAAVRESSHLIKRGAERAAYTLFESTRESMKDPSRAASA